MKVFHLVIGFLILSRVQSTVMRIHPKGFRISIVYRVECLTSSPCKDKGKLIGVTFHVNINKDITPPMPGDFSAIVTEVSPGGFWVFDEVNTYVQGGSVIHYWLEVHIRNDLRLTLVQDRETVPDNYIELFSSCPAGNSTKATCEPSPTTVNHKSVCKGDLIFQDDFTTLDFNVWERDLRIPSDDVDSPFVVFTDSWRTVYAIHGRLYFKPFLMSHVKPIYDEKWIRNGHIKISNCTGSEDKAGECWKRARFAQINPPIATAKIHTRSTFNFRYGIVEIFAKLPEGDWLYPMILLEPVENFYGTRDHTSGQIRIAYNHGNNNDNGALSVFGGAIISGDPAKRLSALKGPVAVPRSYHLYRVTWTEDDITLSIDDKEYGSITGPFAKLNPKVKSWKRGTLLAPFDREFYLTLGLSVGGHFEFPDNNYPNKPWKNGDPKGMYKFWKARENWRPSWNENSQLVIEYVKVYAL